MVAETQVARQKKKKKILAIASGGGHWVQLLRVCPAFSECNIAFVTVNRSYKCDVNGARFYVVRDATRWDKFGLMQMALQMVLILLKERPEVIISTGAAPGYFGIRIGKLLGARTVWIDSIANVEKLSMSGTRVGPHADLWLTQWPHLARPEGPHYQGAVL